MTEARHHHHIPQCYLRGFATGSGKKCRLAVANLENGIFFDTNPRNVAGERDFNRVELEGHKPDALESKLAGFEGEVATSLRNVAASRRFEGDDRRNILNLIALLAVRSPQMREHIRQMSEDMLKRRLGLTLETKERWEAQQEKMADAGKRPAPGEPAISYEEIKNFYDQDEYDINLNREYHIKLEFQMHDPILRALALRKWTLYTTDEDTGLFVTTDRPVMLTYTKPLEVQPLYRNSPGFGVAETEVMFPLTQHIILIGMFEGEDGLKKADTNTVAHANTKMIHGAYGQVYAPKRSVPHLGLDLSVHHDRHFMERYEPLKNKKPPEERK